MTEECLTELQHEERKAILVGSPHQTGPAVAVVSALRGYRAEVKKLLDDGQFDPVTLLLFKRAIERIESLEG